MAAVPLGPFVRFVVAVSGAVYANWDTIIGLVDRHVETGDIPVYGMYVQHVFEIKDSSGAFSGKEKGMVGVHWINTTGGDLDVTWTTADYALVESGFQAYWTALGNNIPSDFRLVEHRWYQFGPGIYPPNPPLRVTTVTPQVGTGSSNLPHQVAETLTFRTPIRRHWGRIYLPIAVTGAQALAGGQLASGVVDGIANGGSTYIKSGTANGLAPVVYDRNRKSMLGITSVEADSVPDVIRRRRPSGTAYKKIVTS